MLTDLPHFFTDETKQQFKMNKQFQAQHVELKLKFDVQGKLDLVDLSSKRRRQKTLAKGVPNPEVNLHLLMPQQYMNRSGFAVQKWLLAHKNLELEDCEYCETTGQRDLGDGEMKDCNACRGKGQKESWEANYPFDTQNVEEFRVFLEQSGGIQIC